MIEKLKETPLFYKNYSLINFIQTNDKEKELILKWRNSDEVRQWMVNKSIITLEEHYNYIDSLKDKKDKLCFLVKEEENYLGIVEFDEIDAKSAFFGLNANSDTKIKGVGRILESISIYIAKELLGLKKLKLYVFNNNERAIRLYERSNYKVLADNSDNKITYMEKTL